MMKIKKQPFISFILLGLWFVASMYVTVTSVIGCKDVIRYTIPTGQLDSDHPSIIAYLRQTGLFRHVSTMPSSAKTDFVRYAAVAIVFAILSILAVLTVIKTVKRSNVEDETHDNLGQIIDESIPPLNQKTIEFALAAVTEAAKRNRASVYNPIVLYSEFETVTSEFLPILKDRLQPYTHGQRILFAKSNDFLTHKEDNSGHKVQNVITSGDALLIIDDIHTLIGDDKLQTDFLERIAQAECQIVLLSACVPSRIPILTDGIRNQFDSALYINLSE